MSYKFGSRWNYHNIIGAIEGKHIAIEAPKNSDSVYNNYKQFFSIILLGLVDTDYKFILVNVVGNGSTSRLCSLLGGVGEWDLWTDPF